MVQVVLRTPFSLINSEFNGFLYAPIGDEGNGMTLSVISALTRLDIDPWQEAERLSVLPKESAIQALAPMIARFPEGHWPLADTREIAGRLAALLPHRVAASPPGNAASMNSGKRYYPAFFLVLYFIWSVAASFVMAPPREAPPTNSSVSMETTGTDSRP